MHVYPFYIYCKCCNIPVHTCTYNVNSLKMNGRTCVKQLIYSSSGSRKLIENFASTSERNTCFSILCI